MYKYSFLFHIEGITDSAILVYRYLDDRANKDGICWPSVPTIARDINRSDRQVRRAVKELKGYGLITTTQRYRQNGGNSSLEYRLTRLDQTNKTFGGKTK